MRKAQITGKKNESSASDTSGDKLRFMLESAKILSMKVDFRTWLLEKARLTVPSLADWCAIDVLNEQGGLERIAVIHRDQKMTDYLFEFEKRFPTTEKNSSDLYTAIRTGEAQFVPWAKLSALFPSDMRNPDACIHKTTLNFSKNFATTLVLFSTTVV